MRRIKLPQLGIVIVVCALVGALAGSARRAAAPSKKTGKPHRAAPAAFA